MLWHGRRFPGKEAAPWWEVDQKKEGECLHPPFCYVATLILHRFVLDFKRTSDTDVAQVVSAAVNLDFHVVAIRIDELAILNYQLVVTADGNKGGVHLGKRLAGKRALGGYGILSGIGDLYVIVGIVLSVLDYMKVLK